MVMQKASNRFLLEHWVGMSQIVLVPHSTPDMQDITLTRQIYAF